MKGEHVYVLVKIFLDTGADILLASQMFSKCLFMQSQPNISISGVLDKSNEIENIRSCKVVIPYKGERNIFSMNNRISKNVPTYFTRNLLCKYMGLTSTQFQMFNMDDYTLERDIDIIFSLENQLDVKTVDFECLDLFKSPLFPNIEIFRSPLTSSFAFGGRLAGTSSDYISPIPELRRKLYLDREVLRQIVLEDQDTGFDLATNNLLELLMTHIYQFHHNSVEMLNFWEKVKQKYKFNQRDCHNIPKAMVNDNCSVHSGHVMSIKDIIVSTQICD